MTLALNVLWLVGLLVYVFWPKRRCGCGRSRPWYFHPEHKVVGWQYAFTTYVAFRCTWLLVHIDWWAPIEALLLTWCVRWLWFHEKDRWKRAARAVGRVFVTEHGRLAVSNER